MHCRSTHIHSTWSPDTGLPTHQLLHRHVQDFQGTPCACKCLQCPERAPRSWDLIFVLPQHGQPVPRSQLSALLLTHIPSCPFTTSLEYYPKIISKEVQPLWSIIPRTPFPLTLSHTDTVLGSEGFIGGSKAKQLPAYIPHTLLGLPRTGERNGKEEAVSLPVSCHCTHTTDLNLRLKPSS